MVPMKRLEGYVHIHDNQFCFAQGKSKLDAIFVVQILQEKYIEKKQKLCHVFVDFEKTFKKCWGK